MKKIFSIVVLAGILMLMSFNSNSVSINNNNNNNKTSEIVKADGEGASRRGNCRRLSRMIAAHYGLNRHDRRAVFHNCMKSTKKK